MQARTGLMVVAVVFTSWLGSCMALPDPSLDLSPGARADQTPYCPGLNLTCSSRTSENTTHFVSSPADPTRPCTFTLDREIPNICQIRLDFHDFQLAPPDSLDGVCIEDFLVIQGAGAPRLPRLCGNNKGQHMYLDVDPDGGPLLMTMDLGPSSRARSWDIQVALIPCDASYRAPQGCLQYFTETSGVVESFNFAQDTTDGTAHLASQQYGVCVRAGRGYGKIMWNQDSAVANSFTMSGMTDAIDPSLIGTPYASSQGQQCTTDYVIIPGGNTGASSSDRYCGLGFPSTVTSSSQPFVLYVVTDRDEMPDNGNRGFRLLYRQLPMLLGAELKEAGDVTGDTP